MGNMAEGFILCDKVRDTQQNVNGEVRKNVIIGSAFDILLNYFEFN